MPRKKAAVTSPQPKFTPFEKLSTEKKVTAFALQMVFLMTGDRGLKDLMDNLDLSTQAANKAYRDGKKYLAEAFEADAKKGKGKGKANQPVLHTSYDVSVIEQNLKTMFSSDPSEDSDLEKDKEEEGSDDEEPEPAELAKAEGAKLTNLLTTKEADSDRSEEDDESDYRISDEHMKEIGQLYSEAKQNKGDRDKIVNLRHQLEDILEFHTSHDDISGLIQEYAQRMGLNWVEVGNSFGYRKSSKWNHFSPRSVDRLL